MSNPARNTLAVVGAGPIGLEAALAALDHGLDVHVFEQGEVGSHPLSWGHVRMFTPWRMNVGPSSAAHLAATGWTSPEPESCPTGAELAERYLAPLARLPELAGRVHTHAQVVHMSRRGALKGDAKPDGARSEHPFRLLVRDAGGRENFLHAFGLIDASGVYTQPNWAGIGGIPARNELYLRPQLAYHLADVQGASRATYAGRRTLVIGGGASAMTAVAALAQLATEVPGTAVVWATRTLEAVGPDVADDPLPERHALRRQARALATGASEAVTHVGGAEVENFEFNSATHRYRVTLMIGDQPRIEEVDQVLVHTGFGPDDSLYRELQVHESYSTRAPMKLAAALSEAGGDCLRAPAFVGEALTNPEPDFFILGHKSYGRNPSFLLETGYRQVADVIARLAARAPAGAPS
jgi:thioredoxin reductase